jgi:hypothetical protein
MPFLRRRFFLQLSNVPISKLRRKSLPTGLRHTRKFEVFLEDFRDCGVGGQYGSTYNVNHSDLYASFIIRILKEMANLRAFRFEMTFFGLAMH